MPDQAEQVAVELYRLMHKRRGQSTKASDLAAVAASPRIQAEARALDSSLHTAPEICAVLLSVLEQLQAQEQAAKGASNHDTSADLGYPLALPAMQLMGLLPTTEGKGVRERQEMAALSRRVSPRTMRDHDGEMAEELAQHLLLPVATAPGEAEIAARLLELRRERRTRKNDGGNRIRADEVYALTDALIASYRDFAQQLSLLIYDCSWAESIEEINDADLYRPLRALAVRDFDRTYPITFELTAVVLRVDGPPGDKPYCLKGRLLRLLCEFFLFPVSETERELLQYVLDTDGGNMHRFISLLQENSQGKEMLATWRAWFSTSPIPENFVIGERAWNTDWAFRHLNALSTDAADTREVVKFLSEHETDELHALIEGGGLFI